MAGRIGRADRGTIKPQLRRVSLCLGGKRYQGQARKKNLTYRRREALGNLELGLESLAFSLWRKTLKTSPFRAPIPTLFQLLSRI